MSSQQQRQPAGRAGADRGGRGGHEGRGGRKRGTGSRRGRANGQDGNESDSSVEAHIIRTYEFNGAVATDVTQFFGKPTSSPVAPWCITCGQTVPKKK